MSQVQEKDKAARKCVCQEGRQTKFLYSGGHQLPTSHLCPCAQIKLIRLLHDHIEYRDN